MPHLTRHAQPAAAFVVRTAQRVERVVVVEFLQRVVALAARAEALEAIPVGTDKRANITSTRLTLIRIG
tara:strand:+ start:161 stop:367 length:207 start_codon:yes stop_codon:yes gene_type:complete